MSCQCGTPVSLSQAYTGSVSSDTLLRLTKTWAEELEQWDARDLSARHDVYLWADGIYFQARTEPDNQCMLVVIGATPEGWKELVGFTDGYRESTQSWRELLVDLKARGLAKVPALAVGEGGWRGRYGLLGCHA